MMFIPPLIMIRAMVALGLSSVFEEQLTLANMFAAGGGHVGKSIEWLFGMYFFYLVLLWYLDKVYVAGYGIRAHPLFFLEKSYWTDTFKQMCSFMTTRGSLVIDSSTEQNGHAAKEYADAPFTPPANVSSTFYTPEDV